MRVMMLHPDHLPSATGIGTAVAMWAIARALLERGHEVLAVSSQLDPTSYARNGESAKQLLRLGVRVSWLAKETRDETNSSVWSRRWAILRNAASQKPEQLYPTVSLGNKVRSVIRAESPDLLFLYAERAIMSVATIDKLPPTMAVQVNVGTQESRLSILRPHSFRERLWNRAAVITERHADKMLAQQMSRFHGTVSFAASTTEWLRQHGVDGCEYFPMPIQDNAGEKWALSKAAAQAALTKPKILMAGFLRGTPTMAGLLYFAKEVLPRLEQRFGPNGFEVHVVGPGTLRPAIEEALRRPSVIIRGFVPDIAQEFRSATVLVTPTPFVLGARTRIAEAFSFGCCIVAHSAEQAGMPELVNEDTALLGSTGFEIARQISRALTDATLRHRLERNARLVFERRFDQKVSATRLAEKMEAVAGLPEAALIRVS